jgi:hypothetical protein
MAKAVIRALAVSAARGQLRPRQAFTKLLAETEHTRKERTNRVFDAALDYKLNGNKSSNAERVSGSPVQRLSLILTTSNWIF